MGSTPLSWNQRSNLLKRSFCFYSLYKRRVLVGVLWVLQRDVQCCFLFSFCSGVGSRTILLKVAVNNFVFSRKPRLYKRVCASVGPWVRGSVRNAFFSAGRDEPANDLFRVYELVFLFHSVHLC